MNFVTKKSLKIGRVIHKHHLGIFLNLVNIFTFCNESKIQAYYTLIIHVVARSQKTLVATDVPINTIKIQLNRTKVYFQGRIANVV